MIRRLHLTHAIALAVWVGFVTPGTLAAQTPEQIHPAPGSPDGPIVIAVLADNFTSSQKDEFNEAAANLVLHGLLADPYFAENKSKVVIKTIFDPSTDYGFELDSGSTRCSVKWDQTDTPSNTHARILTAGAAVSPFRTVVIGNYGYNFGCMDGQWAYVTVGATGHPVLEHEFGHLLGDLLDEYVDRGHETTPHKGVEPDRNCAPDDRSPPWWAELETRGLQNTPGCDHAGIGVIRPSQHCRMLSHSDTFCVVCRHLMDSALQDFEADLRADLTFPALPSAALQTLRISTAGFFAQTPQPRQLGTQSVQVLLKVAAPKAQAPPTTPTVISATNVTGPVVLRSRRVGDYVFEVSESGNTIAVGVVTGNPFETRLYRGTGAPHDRSESATANILVVIPGETLQQLVEPKRAVQITLYPVPPQTGMDTRIDAKWLNDLRAQKRLTAVAQLPAQSLKDKLTEILRSTK